MVFDVVPFYEVKSIWIGRSNGGKRLEYVDVKRAYSKCVENEICPGFVNSSQESAAMFLQNVTKISERMPETETGADNLHYIRDMVDRACELYRNNKMEEFNAQVNEVRDEISKVVILNDETWEGLRCRICPSCATAIPTCFCLCLECEAQLISTGRYYIHVNSDDEEDNQNPNVSGDAKRAQEEANHGAAAQEDDDEAEEVPGEEDDMDTQGYTSGYASEEDDSGWYYRDTDLTSRDIINSQRMAICLDEPREAQYMAGFIALQMSKMWGMFEGGEERTMNAQLEGRPGCPYHNDFKRYPNMTEHDQERDEYIRMMVCKREGLYTFYKLWIAARILDVTKDEMKLLVKDYSKKCVRAREAQKNLDEAATIARLEAELKVERKVERCREQTVATQSQVLGALSDLRSEFNPRFVCHVSKKLPDGVCGRLVAFWNRRPLSSDTRLLRGGHESVLYLAFDPKFSSLRDPKFQRGAYAQCVGDSAGMGLFNQALRPFGMGAFHCGVEVHGEEWSFRDVMPGHQDKAIFGCEPRRCRGHRYQESLELGFTYLSKKEVRQLLQLMLARWPGAKYNVLSNNCCHFCDEFCRLLGVGAIPSRLFTLAKLARAMLTSMQALEQRRQDAAAFIRGSEAFQVGCCTPAATAPKEVDLSDIVKEL
ncbi:unnamed protein product [Effrenium voratum]|uniref:PPPDE domain-containing protein n=1 Tax=Effrenium voratum TaxID=2562239 RepID=A0AA36I6Y2_9DINO|nr:unnamed protein product [Effrenium voratum]